MTGAICGQIAWRSRSNGPAPALSKAEIAKALGKSKPTRYINDLMKKLVLAGQVAYTLPEKPNSRLQKYRLTPTGQALLAKHLSTKQESGK